MHEAAHFIDGPLGMAVNDPIAANRDVQQLLVTLAAQVEPDDSEPLPWAQHGQKFVRAAAHLAYRVGSFAQQITPDDLRFGERYYGPEFTECEWIDSLSDELERSTNKPLRAVLKTPAPAEFKAAWNRATSCKNYSAIAATRQ